MAGERTVATLLAPREPALADIDEEAAVLGALARGGCGDLVAGLPDGLETQLGREFGVGVDLSTGQWQKVALGRAMMRDDPLLLVEVMTALAESELARGRTVVVDTVATTEEVRAEWRQLAMSNAARLLVILCVCGDESEHRRRIEGRRRGIPGWPELTWTDVESVRLRFEPWSDEHLTIDAMESVTENLKRVLAYVA